MSRCYEPVFEEVLVGCLVRVSIGPNHMGVQTYRVCIVQSVETDLTRPVSGTPPLLPEPHTWLLTHTAPRGGCMVRGSTRWTASGRPSMRR